MDMDESTIYCVIILQTKAIWNYNWELPNLILHRFCDYDFKFIGETWEMGVILTHVLCTTTCYVLQVLWKFHPFPDLELWWILWLVGSFCSFYVGRNNIKDDTKNCKKNSVHCSTQDDVMCLVPRPKNMLVNTTSFNMFSFVKGLD